MGKHICGTHCQVCSGSMVSHCQHCTSSASDRCPRNRMINHKHTSTSRAKECPTIFPIKMDRELLGCLSCETLERRYDLHFLPQNMFNYKVQLLKSAASYTRSHKASVKTLSRHTPDRSEGVGATLFAALPARSSWDQTPGRHDVLSSRWIPARCDLEGCCSLRSQYRAGAKSSSQKQRLCRPYVTHQ